MSTTNSDPIQKIELWYENNKELVNKILVGVLVAVAAFMAYKYFYVNPRNEKAANSIYIAEQFFMDNNYEMALKGQGSAVPGFLTIMDKYSGTPQANLSRFYAGVCYLNQGNYDQAIKYLKKFDGEKSLLEYRAYGCIGDAYAQKGDFSKALSFYKKASANKEDLVNGPVYLMREAMLEDKAGNVEAAKKALLKIRKEYPTSSMGNEVDKYLARLGYTELY